MRASWSQLAVEAVDYEIVRIGTPAAFDELGSFRDVFVADGPPWRLVAGYLMLEQTGHERLEVFSHGRPAASITLAGGAVLCETRGDVDWRVVGATYRTGGVALLVEAGDVDSGGRTLHLPPDAWSATIVHGPAEEKIDARVALYRSLQRVGGRRG